MQFTARSQSLYHILRVIYSQSISNILQIQVVVSGPMPKRLKAPKSPLLHPQRHLRVCTQHVQFANLGRSINHPRRMNPKNMSALQTRAGPGSVHSILCLSACPTFSCPGIYIIEDKNVKSPVYKHISWCFGASQAAGSSSEVPRSYGGRGRRDQNPVRAARGAQVSERYSPRTRDIFRPVFRLQHPLDPG